MMKTEPRMNCAEQKILTGQERKRQIRTTECALEDDRIASETEDQILRSRFDIFDSDNHIFLAPEGQARQQILFLNSFVRSWPILLGKNSRLSCKLRPDNFASHGAGRDPHLRVVTNALIFARITARLYIEFVVLFAKPDGSRNRRASFAEGDQADVFLAMYFRRYWHSNIVRRLVANDIRLAGEWMLDRSESLTFIPTSFGT